jgi:hypothetical protein
MAELTFKSAGVSLREIDLSGPTKVGPSGTPAGVIGTAVRGPAFVPITVGTFQDFIATFGNSDGKKFGPMAVREWLNNASSATYVKVLGAGDGKTRNSEGDVTNAGFVVGEQQVQPNGIVGAGQYNGTTSAAAPGPLGKTYFLGVMMSESNGSGIFSQPGIQTSATSVPILRGVLMAASGVMIGLSASVTGTSNNTPAANTNGFAAFGDSGAGNAGANIGSVVTSNAKQEFTLLLNGLKNSDSYKNVITASFDPEAGNYFANLFNTDPTQLEPAGHYLYTHYDIAPSLAVVTGTGFGAGTNKGGFTEGAGSLIALLLTSSLGRNTGNASSTTTSLGVPNFEAFSDRFRNAFSPFVVSQKFGGVNQNLFKLHARSDGEVSSAEFKITIENIQASTNTVNKFGTFDLLVRKFDDTDVQPIVLEAFRGLNLDPTSNKYIAKAIGDTDTFFDFDQPLGKQRLVVEGDYPNVSQYVYVQLSSGLKDGSIDPTALPTGFRGPHHLVLGATTVTTVGSVLTGTISGSTNTGGTIAGITTAALRTIKEPAFPLRRNLATGLSPKKVVQPALTWGTQFELLNDANEPNKNQLIDSTLVSLTKYFPLYHLSQQNAFVGDNAGTANVGGAVIDSDLYNRNFFSLERVEVITGSTDRPDPTQWAVAAYRRDGVAVSSITDTNDTSRGSRFLDASKDFGDLPSKKYLKFTFPMQGGFDGVNIFNKDKSEMTNNAVLREFSDSTNQGGVSGPTVAAYRKAIDVLKNKTDADIQLLAIPGIRDTSVTDYATDAVETRFDSIYLMDIQEKDNVASIVTGSNQLVSVASTVAALQSRGLDSSFAAAYFPDVVITDPATKTNVSCPPSVAVIGAFSLNDKIGFPWFAPAGFTRGALATVLDTNVKLSQDNLDTLYGADINPITQFPGTPKPVVFGQKTLMAAQSALDRVNVRRLLIDIRRKVRAVANTFIFEPNRASTLAAFSAQVTPILSSVQAQQGLDRFSVRIDTTTTTQADVENNTIRGKIFLQPTKSVEFISLDFVVTNAGAQV